MDIFAFCHPNCAAMAASCYIRGLLPELNQLDLPHSQLSDKGMEDNLI